MPCPRLSDALSGAVAKGTPPGSGAAAGTGGTEVDAGGTLCESCTVVKLAAVAVLGIRPVPGPVAGFAGWAEDPAALAWRAARRSSGARVSEARSAEAASLDLLPDQPRLSRSSSPDRRCSLAASAGSTVRPLHGSYLGSLSVSHLIPGVRLKRVLLAATCCTELPSVLSAGEEGCRTSQAIELLPFPRTRRSPLHAQESGNHVPRRMEVIHHTPRKLIYTDSRGGGGGPARLISHNPEWDRSESERVSSSRT